MNNKQKSAMFGRLLLSSCILFGIFALNACDRSDNTPQPTANNNGLKKADYGQPAQKPSVSPARYWVYIDNGAIQCERKGLMPDKTANKLVQAGIKVKASACATITGSMMATQCGLKDLDIHLHEIEQSQLKQARGLGFEPVESISHHGDKGFKLTSC